MSTFAKHMAYELNQLISTNVSVLLNPPLNIIYMVIFVNYCTPLRLLLSLKMLI